MRGDNGSLWLSSFGEIGQHNRDYRERKAFVYCEKELSGAQFGFIRFRLKVQGFSGLVLLHCT
jgi:hypothetical protein